MNQNAIASEQLQVRFNELNHNCDTLRNLNAENERYCFEH